MPLLETIGSGSARAFGLNSFADKEINITTLSSASNLVMHLDAADSSSYSGSGSVWTDLTGNGNNATAGYSNYGTPTFNNGGTKANKYFYHNLTKFRVPPTSSNNISGSLTAAIWLYPESGDTGRFFQKDGQETSPRCWEMGNNGGSYRLELWDSAGNNFGAPFGATMPYNEWQFIVLKHDAPGKVVYHWQNKAITGTNSFPSSNGSTRTGAEIQIGGSWGVGEWFRGRIAKCMLYNAALSDSQLLALYNATAPRYGLS